SRARTPRTATSAPASSTSRSSSDRAARSALARSFCTVIPAQAGIQLKRPASAGLFIRSVVDLRRLDQEPSRNLDPELASLSAIDRVLPVLGQVHRNHRGTFPPKNPVARLTGLLLSFRSVDSRAEEAPSPHVSKAVAEGRNRCRLH